MYQITDTMLAGNKMITITHKKTGNHVSIMADYGGALNSFVVGGKDILTSACSAADFEKSIVRSFAGNQLFPYPNRVNNATYSIQGKPFYLPLNDDAPFPHSLHGLVYNQPFTVSEINEPDGSVKLNYHFRENAKSYPFEFLLVVEYILQVDCLQINTSITNLSSVTAPIGYGWHPYIAVNGIIDDCRLQLPSTKYYEADERLIPTGKTGELKKFSALAAIGNTELNHCFQMPDREDVHTTTVATPDGTFIRLIQKGYQYTQYYIPPGRSSIAVEPQTCIADALNNKTGLIMMQPGEVLDLSFSIAVQTINPS